MAATRSAGMTPCATSANGETQTFAVPTVAARQHPCTWLNGWQTDQWNTPRRWSSWCPVRRKLLAHASPGVAQPGDLAAGRDRRMSYAGAAGENCCCDLPRTLRFRHGGKAVTAAALAQSPCCTFGTAPGPVSAPSCRRIGLCAPDERVRPRWRPGRRHLSWPQTAEQKSLT